MAKPETVPNEQVPSAERREEVRKLWIRHDCEYYCGMEAPHLKRCDSFWSFIAALDAQSAERTRVEVEKMREAAAKVCDDEDQELAYGGQHDLWRAAQRALKEAAAQIRNLPIEGTSP